MLQQTQTARVFEKYPAFLRRFPTLKKLARARRDNVIRAWRGMGYNNRAVRLHESALRLVGEHNGKIPSRYDILSRLPGVGRYTANAVLSFAFHRRMPVVETNVRRVLSRILYPMRRSSDVAATPMIWKDAERMLPERRSYDWNQALMDLGATICTSRAPKCITCPVRTLCRSAGSMSADAVRTPKQEPSFRGTPNRIYRGRVVELLRREPKHRGIAFPRLGPALHCGFRRTDRAWLASLLGSLERDGLVRISQRGSAAPTVHLA
jgi:A/G-specific adenine glycosylase